MGFFDDVKSYVDKAQRGTFGALGAVGGSMIGLPTASLVGLARLVQGKSPQEALTDVALKYGEFVNGGEQWGREHASEISSFLMHMMEEISREAMIERARARAREVEE